MDDESWFRLIEEEFARAARAGADVVDRSYVVAGLTLRLRFADAALLPLITPALRHLESHPIPSHPSLTVLVCQSPPGAIPIPAPVKAFSPRGDPVGFHSARFKFAVEPAGKIATAFDTERAIAVHSIAAPDAVTLHERTYPMRGLFGWWMRLHGRQLVHGAVVGTSEGGILLGGQGSSGKSNTALACLQAGLAFGGDDFCSIESSPRAIAHSLYATARTATADWRRLPFLEAVAAGPIDAADGQNAYFLHPTYADRLLPSVTIRAIVLPSVNDRKQATLAPATPAAAAMALAPRTISLLPDAGREVFENVCSFAKLLPCYRLEVGSEFAPVLALIRGLLH